MRLQMLSIFLVGMVASTSFARIPAGGNPDTDVTLIYEPDTGNFAITSAEPITTFEAKSEAGNFTGNALGLGGLFDVNDPRKLFKLAPDGFTNIDFGPALKPGLTASEFAADLTIDGSYLAGGSLRVYFIPEPSGLTLLSFGVIGALVFRNTTNRTA